MLVIGIVGGIASGKSFVSEQWSRLGAVVLDADQLGHEVLKEPEVIESIRRRWGAAVIDEKGQVDRRAVARIVFAPPPDGPRELEFLEQVTHPRIEQKLRRRIEQLRRERRNDVVLLDAALLFEAGWDRMCDRILFVDADESIRRERAGRQRGWDEAMFSARQAAQGDLAKKRADADWVVDNSADPETTKQQIQAIWHSLTAGDGGRE